MRSAVVVALVAVGVLGGGYAATQVLTAPPEHVHVDLVNPASQVAPVTEPTTSPTATPTARKVVKHHAKPRQSVASKTTTARTVTVHKEVTVSEPAPDPTPTSAPADRSVQATPGSPPPVVLGTNDQTLAPTPTP